ncbi:MAG TPA: ECF-type sigma factor [Pirellulales bacterium]|nr:ECF-type sigma factor [Pirellulales bacterium]
MGRAGRDARAFRFLEPFIFFFFRFPSMNEISESSVAFDGSDQQSAERLLPLVYGELRRLAAQKMAQEKPGQTIDATALVHEAYLRLVDADLRQLWNSRGHFFAAAAEAMRRILVDRARHKRTLKSGGDWHRVEMADLALASAPPNLDLLALNDAIDKLEQQDRRLSQLVKLRFFAGLTKETAAEALGISKSAADSDWAYARAWLRVEIEGDTT